MQKETQRKADSLEVEKMIYEIEPQLDIKAIGLDIIHLLYAGAIITKGGFMLELEHVKDSATGFDLFEALEAVVTYFYHTGDMRGFLKDYGTHILLVAQAGDVWNVKNG